MKTTQCLLSLILICSIPSLSLAQEPELSADKPISYQADQSLLIAEGNAIYSDGRIRLVADRIEFFRDEGLIKANGNVSVTRKGVRLVTDWVEYDTQNRNFSCGPFRAGSPPFFLEGDGFAGDPDEINLESLSLSIKEPSPSSPKLKINSSMWIPDEMFEAKGVGLRVPLLGKLPLPSFTFDGNTEAIEISGELGYRKSLGAYGRSKILYPFYKDLSLGGNLDLYSERGVLVGPAFNWRKNFDQKALRIALDSGWIRDQDPAERGLDRLNQVIDREREFIELEAFFTNSESVQFNTYLKALSDSEVLRDFRPDDYFIDYQPDAFAEFIWMGENIALNIFGRTRINDYYGFTERLPEVRLEGLPTKLGETRLIAQWALQFSNLKEYDIYNDPFTDANPFLTDTGLFDSIYLLQRVQDSRSIQRIEGSLKFARPYSLTPATTFTPLISSRWSHYSDSQLADNIDRFVNEFGADLDYTLAKSWQVESKTWNLKSIRHVFSAVAHYRYYQNGDDYAGQIASYDRPLYNPALPEIDLFDIRHTDVLTELSLLRIGIENRWEGKDFNGKIRTLGTLNIYEDIIFSDRGKSQEAFYFKGSLSPLEWLRLDWEQKVLAENLQTEATFFRLAIRSADLWEAGIVAEYIDGVIEQYGFDGAYRITEKNSLLTSIRYDSRTDVFTRQQYGLRHRFANVWELELYVQLNDQNARDDDLSFGIRIKLLDF